MSPDRMRAGGMPACGLPLADTGLGETLSACLYYQREEKTTGEPAPVNTIAILVRLGLR